MATLPSTPALRREQIKLQVALITPLIHVKGFAAPETKAAVEQARRSSSELKRLESLRDPLLLFSVLYGLWVASYVAFNGDVMRELATQFLALAEKQGATVPLMIGHRLMGISLASTGRHHTKPGALRSRDQRSTILSSIVRWRRDLAMTIGWQSCPIGRGLWVAWFSRGRARRRGPHTNTMRARSAKPLL